MRVRSNQSAEVAAFPYRAAGDEKAQIRRLRQVADNRRSLKGRNGSGESPVPRISIPKQKAAVRNIISNVIQISSGSKYISAGLRSIKFCNICHRNVLRTYLSIRIKPLSLRKICAAREPTPLFSKAA